MQLPLNPPRNGSNGCETTSLVIYPEVSKLVIKETGDVVVESVNKDTAVNDTALCSKGTNAIFIRQKVCFY